MSVQNYHAEDLFVDAPMFYQEFLSFLEHSPRSSPPFTLHAKAVVDYLLDVEGESLQEVVTLYTAAATVQGDLKEWWRTNVYDPVRRFLSRFECADVVSIYYFWQ
jgi:hypothetical protein